MFRNVACRIHVHGETEGKPFTWQQFSLGLYQHLIPEIIFRRAVIAVFCVIDVTFQRK